MPREAIEEQRDSDRIERGLSEELVSRFEQDAEWFHIDEPGSHSRFLGLLQEAIDLLIDDDKFILGWLRTGPLPDTEWSVSLFERRKQRNQFARLAKLAELIRPLCEEQALAINSRIELQARLESKERQDQRDVVRTERMANRPPIDLPSADQRRCARCQTRPARIDDLCKRCARDAGIIVRGKIGGAEPV